MRASSALDLAIRAMTELLAAAPVAASARLRKNPDLWVFGAWLGRRYADNPRYLFEHVSREVPEVRAIWLTRRSRIRRQLRARGLQSELWWSPGGIRAAIRAGAWFFTHEPSDISPIAGRGALTVNLTHGTPLKRIGRAAGPGRLPGPLAWLGSVSASVRPSTAVVACASPIAVERFSAAERAVAPASIVATGYPRWNPFASPSPLPAELQRKMSRASLTILYAPSQRAFGEGTLEYPKVAGFSEYLAWLEHVGGVTLYRGHLASRSPSDVGHRSWIPVSESICADINDLLPHVDVLITDYSSIFYDYCLFRERAVFLAPDLESYRHNDQGFFVDYEHEVPGPVVDDWNGVIRALKTVPDPDLLAGFRARHGVLADGGACGRLVDLVTRGLQPRST